MWWHIGKEDNVSAKRRIYDFICAFFVFSIILLSFALLSGEGLLEDAVVWEGEKSTLYIFGTEIVFEENLAGVMHELLTFNDIVFGSGFSESLYKCFEFAREYVSDGICGAYNVAKAVVGAA